MFLRIVQVNKCLVSLPLQITFGVLLLQRVQRVKNNQKLGIVSSHHRQEREHPTQEVSQRH